jgi:hypothetical protein
MVSGIGCCVDSELNLLLKLPELTWLVAPDFSLSGLDLALVLSRL